MNWTPEDAKAFIADGPDNQIFHITLGPQDCLSFAGWILLVREGSQFQHVRREVSGSSGHRSRAVREIQLDPGGVAEAQ